MVKGLTMATAFVRVELLKEEIEECLRHGRLMREGRVGLGNVKYGDVDNVENYTDGKIGEYALAKWLKKNNVAILHAPFREDYSRLSAQDDFIVELRGRRVQVEAKHKTRNVPPKEHYEQCSDRISSSMIYVFTERQRTGQAPKVGEPLAPAHFAGPVHLVGWIYPTKFRERADFTPKGTIKTNDRGGRNFVTHRDEYNIVIRHLLDMSELLTPQYDDCIPWLE
jgi:hypothetical protein